MNDDRDADKRRRTVACDCGGRRSPQAIRCRPCFRRDHEAREPERLWARIDKSAGPDACWPWTGGLSGDGYGRFSRYRLAHRMVLAEKLGRPVQGDSRHTCDNRPCCNPAHLLEGTRADNMRDMAERGRTTRGRPLSEAHRRKLARSHLKLTAEVVVEVRQALAAGERQTVIAERYGVAPSLIRRIKFGRTWNYGA